MLKRGLRRGTPPSASCSRRRGRLRTICRLGGHRSTSVRSRADRTSRFCRGWSWGPCWRYSSRLSPACFWGRIPRCPRAPTLPLGPFNNNKSNQKYSNLRPPLQPRAQNDSQNMISLPHWQHRLREGGGSPGKGEAGSLSALSMILCFIIVARVVNTSLTDYPLLALHSIYLNPECSASYCPS